MSLPLSLEKFLTYPQEASILKGQRESLSLSHEVIADVNVVGSGVSRLRTGDRVICLSPGKFDSSFIVDETCCRALLPYEDGADLCGRLIPICTALYAMRQIRRPKPGYVG